MMQDETGFDIESQKQLSEQMSEGAEVHVESIRGEPLYLDGEPVIIRVAAANSSRFRRAEEALRKRKLKPRQFTAEQLHDDQLEKVVACTLEWRGIVSQGKPVELTPHNARMLYRACPWVLEQVISAMNDPELFFKKG